MCATPKQEVQPGHPSGFKLLTAAAAAAVVGGDAILPLPLRNLVLTNRSAQT